LDDEPEHERNQRGRRIRRPSTSVSSTIRSASAATSRPGRQRPGRG